MKFLLEILIISLLVCGCTSISQTKENTNKRCTETYDNNLKKDKNDNLNVRQKQPSKLSEKIKRYESLSIVPKGYKEPEIFGKSEIDLTDCKIRSFYPIRTKAGILTVCTGENFGETPGIIKIGNTVVEKYLSWSNNFIYFRMPEGVKDSDVISIGKNEYKEKIILAPDDVIKVIVQVDADVAQQVVTNLYDEALIVQVPLQIKGQWLKNGNLFGNYDSGWDLGETVPMFLLPGTSIWISEMLFIEKNFEQFKKKIVYFAIEDSNYEDRELSIHESDWALILKNEWGKSDDIDESDNDPGFKVSKKFKNYIEEEKTVYAVFPPPEYRIPFNKHKLSKATLEYDLKSISVQPVNDEVKVRFNLDKYEKGDKINIYTKINKRKEELVTTTSIDMQEITIKVKPLQKAVVIAKIVNKNGVESEGKTSEIFVTQMKNVKYDNCEGRDLYIYLPEGYNRNSSEKYPVLYMFDGQNLFTTDYVPNEWKVDELCDELIEKGKINKTIVVGISNGKAKRGIEYNPYVSKEGVEHGKFIIEKVLPFIEKNYNVKSGRENRGIAGSSLGGLMTLYMLNNYSDYFSFYGALSTYDLWGLDSLKKAGKSDSKIWIDAGTGEFYAEGTNYYSYPEQARRIVDILMEKGYVYGKELYYLEDKNAKHIETDWNKRLDNIFLIFQGANEGKLSNIKIDMETYKLDNNCVIKAINPIMYLDNGIRFSALSIGDYSISQGAIDKKGIVELKDGFAEIKVKCEGIELNKSITEKDFE